MAIRTFVVFITLTLFFPVTFILATDYSSTNFTVKDPVIIPGGGYATSTTYQLWNAVSQLAIGISSSTAFTGKSGFLYFPTVATTTPTPSPSPTPTPSGGGGGGGGSGTTTVQTAVTFKGRAYPSSNVNLLENAALVAITKAGPDANFEITVSGLSGGTYAFGIWASDYQGLRSVTQTFTVLVTPGVTTVISGIFLPPTIGLDKIQVKRGDILNIFGQSVPSSTITVAVNSVNQIVKQILADASGIWLYKFDSLLVELGDHSAGSRSTVKVDISEMSQLVFFKVGNQNISASLPKNCPARGDFNNDCRVDLIDFSIMAYWYNRPTPPAKIDLDNDGKINLIDFSILAYYWTG